MRNGFAGIEVRVSDGDTYTFGGLDAKVFEVPGHTTGHIAYYFESEGIAFVGDTLFALGCGRLFEGTPEMMWNSLQKLMALPDDTVVYCAHEYTQANAEFALSVEPGNDRLVARSKEIDELRAKGLPTVPTTIGLERKTNPFVRPMSENLQATIGLSGARIWCPFSRRPAIARITSKPANPVSASSIRSGPVRRRAGDAPIPVR